MSRSVLILPLRSWLGVAGAVALLLAACGGSPTPPKRGVLESNVSSWRFRRYQKLLDVEVWVPGNAAVGHTATYVRKDAERAGRIDPEVMVNAFVTRYQQDRGVLRALVEFARRLEKDAGYDVEMQSIGDVLVISITGQGEAWALWYTEGHILKVGGRGLESVPEEMVEAYGDRYPSRLTSDVLDRPLPPVEAAPGEEAPAYDPENPTPDWEEYRSSKEGKPAGNEDQRSDDRKQ